MRRFQEELSAFFRELYVDEQKTLVFGEGNEHARVMMVGEAPGEQEVREGRPFAGKAGKNLDEFLALSGLKRDEMYITNTVKFRPVRVSSAGRTVNRPPTTEEVKLSAPWLMREIGLVQPQVVVTLGNVPLKALLDRSKTVGALHGQWIEWKDGIRVYPMYHPASLIYNPSLGAVYEADVLRLAEAVRGA